MKRNIMHICISNNLTIFPIHSCLMLLQCILNSTSLFGWKLVGMHFKWYPCYSIIRNSLERYLRPSGSCTLPQLRSFGSWIIPLMKSFGSFSFPILSNLKFFFFEKASALKFSTFWIGRFSIMPSTTPVP